MAEEQNEQAQAQQTAPGIIPSGPVEEEYCDGIVHTHYLNGAVKLDLLTLVPNGTDKPGVYIRKRLVMTLPQFLGSSEVINQMINELVDKKVISKD